MKVFCEYEIPLPADAMPVEAKRLGNVDIVNVDMDYHHLVQVEKVGPDGIPVPEAFDDPNVSDAEIALCSYCVFSGEGMDKFPNLKVIATIRAGIENLDVEAATERGIVCIHCPGRNAEAVSDHAVGLLLSEVLNISRQHKLLSEGIWQRHFSTTPFTPQFRRKTVGIFGFGNIGVLTARKLSGFDMDITAYDPFVSEEKMKERGVRKVDKETLFRESDFVICHARLVPETYHTIGAAEFALMKPHSWFVNNARSGLIDMDALVEALREHRIAGAALDVFDVEPLPADSPLLELDNVTLTPHVAGGPFEAFQYAAWMAVNGIESVLDNAPNFQVLNPQVLKREEFQEWLKDANKRLGRG